MRVREGMSEMVLTVGPHHTLREAATLMSERNVGAAVVMDPEAPGPGIVIERDVLHSIGSG
jgi:CBS domain-containing protein